MTTAAVTLKPSGLESGAVRPVKSMTVQGAVTPTSLAGIKATLSAQFKKGGRPGAPSR